MDKQLEKYCPNCNKAFTCKRDDIVNCQCYNIVLSEATKAFLLKTNFGCLCKECLNKFNQITELTKELSFPTKPEMLVEGLHYYKEDNYLVFTEIYHLLRGFCCKNDCRHCVYGYKK
ncbi:MAG: cysteine-rich CWC family protein [Saprospiraceae bacterium]